MSEQRTRTISWRDPLATAAAAAGRTGLEHLEAILRGELRADAAGVSAHVVSTVGAGDVLTGTLLARLAASDFYPSAVAAALPGAVEASARACERWGALE